MPNPTKLQHRIREELEWEPSLNAAQIGVAVSQPGIVTLTGAVGTYGEKVIAERVAKQVGGVLVVANDIEVQLPCSMKRIDTDLAQAVVRALEWDIAVPHERIQSRVQDGWVTLEGDVALQFQRSAAENAVRRVSGIRGVSNLIRLQGTPAVQPNTARERIESAFQRDELFLGV